MKSKKESVKGEEGKRRGERKTHVANTGNTVLSRLEKVNEGNDDPRSRRTESMTESDSATEDVELLSGDVEELLVGDGDGGERLVDLEFGDLVDGETGALEGGRDGTGGSDGEVDGSAGSVGEGCSRAKKSIEARQNNKERGKRIRTDDLGERSKAKLGNLVLRGKDESGSSVVEVRGVGGGNSSGLLEDRLEAGDLLGLDLLVLLVLLDNDVSSTGVLQGNGSDLVLEGAGLPRLSRLAVRLEAVRVLVLTSDLVLLGGQVGGNAHGVVTVDVGKTVLDDGVEGGDVAEGSGSAGVVEASGGGKVSEKARKKEEK